MSDFMFLVPVIYYAYLSPTNRDGYKTIFYSGGQTSVLLPENTESSLHSGASLLSPPLGTQDSFSPIIRKQAVLLTFITRT